MVACGCKDNSFEPCRELGKQIDQVGFLVLLWDEDVVLNKCIDCFVLVTDLDLDWVVKRGSLKLLYF